MQPAIDKHINGIEVDYKGIFLIYLYVDGVNYYTYTLPNATTRTQIWIDFPLASRKPFQKIYPFYYTVTTGSIMYALEIDFGIEPRRRNG